ncbi:MAG: M20/M25/M40 family metallo-hydrolase [Caldilineales bacterium]
MDTVPPGDDAWQPFEPRAEVKEYRGGTQPFLVGRGAVDDKGPGILALSVLESAARQFDGTDALDDWTLEVSFDTAEETDMSMRYYLDAVGAPELGIVFDAYWCVRAEKGIERPVFSVPLGDAAAGDLWLTELRTPDGAVNQIPDQATRASRATTRPRSTSWLRKSKACTRPTASTILATTARRCRWTATARRCC